MFRGIRKLSLGIIFNSILAGSAYTWPITQYWDVPAARPAHGMDDQQFIARRADRLEETVELRLMSDVPLGMFLERRS